MHEVLEILQQRGLLKRKTPSLSAVERLSITSLVDMSKEIHEAVAKTHTPISNPTFSFSSSMGLSGGGRRSSECNSIDCRIKKINQLTRFAAMYSDKIYILNPFIFYEAYSSKKHLQRAKDDLVDDLKIISIIIPLLNSGHIGVFSLDPNLCFACTIRKFLSNSASKKFMRGYQNLKTNLLRNISVNCELLDSESVFFIDAPTPYLDHGQIFIRDGIPSTLIKRPRIKNKLFQGDCVSLSQPIIRDLEIHERLAHSIATNAMFGLATSSALSTNFVTENDTHISFLNSLHFDSNIVSKNRIAEKYLSSIVPFLNDLRITDIIKVREREQDAFLLYRKALNQATRDFSNSGSRFTIRDAQALYGDVIAPDLAALNKKVQKAKRDLLRKPFRSATALTGVISFGLLTGLISPDISAIATTIGLVKFGSDLVKDVMALGDAEESIKNQPFYFLWKVKQKA
jgi:hypothetical protein